MATALADRALPDDIRAGVLTKPNDQRREGERARVRAVLALAVRHYPTEVLSDLAQGRCAHAHMVPRVGRVDQPLGIVPVRGLDARCSTQPQFAYATGFWLRKRP